MKSVKHHELPQTLIKNFASLFLFLISFSIYSQEIDMPRYDEGKKIFKSQCASCHKLDKTLIGPALGKIEEKRENEWLIAWIKNNVELQKTDADAREAAEFSPTAMTAFPQLSDKQINDVLYYTTIGKIKKAGTAEVATSASGGDSSSGGAPKWVTLFLAIAIGVAFLIIFNLLKTISELKGAPKTPGLLGQTAELWQGIKKNTFLHVLGVIFVALIGAYFIFGNLFKVGVDQGYQPIQPIAFSHKIHAGDNKIECQYCHSAAKHSKHSGIPSVNVCMNCHKNISEVAEDTKVIMEDGGIVLGKAELDKEIQKIYDAAGWDPEKLAYTGKTKPVKWVRVHNLPDFAYFNHSQHVTVGGVSCQKCHGPVEEMEEVYQYSSLTMGWCIDCHKETNVDLKGNEYYAKIHEELAKKYGVEKVTVAQLGGKECGKCHY